MFVDNLSNQVYFKLRERSNSDETSSLNFDPIKNQVKDKFRELMQTNEINELL
jgi:hypothetical protein